MSETLTPGTDPARIDPALIAPARISPAQIAPARIAPARTAPSQIAPATPSRRITWFTLVGLLLVPVTIGGLLLAGLWNPTASLDTVTAAIVNNDEPVQVEGQTVPLGRQLSAALVEPGETTAVGGTTYRWVLTDEGDAAQGLASGEYTAVVTIPPEFSAAATSTATADGTPVQATIDVQTSAEAGLIDPAITAALTAQAKRVLGAQITRTYLENLFVGFGQMSTALSSLSDGAAQLDEGVGQLADGSQGIADGAAQLAEGSSGLADGTAQLAGGIGKAADGAGQLAGGTDSLAGGLAKLATGSDDLAGGAAKLATGSADLADAAKQVATGAEGVATGAAALASGAGQAATATAAAGTAAANSYQGVLGLAGDLQQVSGDLQKAFAICQANPGDIAGCQQALGAALSGLPDQEQLTAVITAAATADGYLNGAQGKPGLVAGSTQLASGADELAAGAKGLASGAGQVADGAAALATGADGLAGGAAKLAKGAADASDGAAALAAGAGSLSAGMGKLATGSDALAGGAAQASDGAGRLADGAASLADGAAQAADGSTQLADGIGQLSATVPSYPEARSKDLANVLTTPIAAGDSSGGPVGASGAALFAALALWIGSLVTYLVLAPIPPRTLESSRSSWRLALRGYLPGLGLGLVQGLILAAMMLLTVLEESPTGAVGFAAFCMVVGAAFGAVQQGLAALFGSVGRFLAMTAAVAAFVAGIAASSPAWLATTTQLLPLGPAMDGIRQLAADGSMPWGTLLMLLVWLAIGLLLAVAGVSRHRRASVPAAPSHTEDVVLVA